MSIAAEPLSNRSKTDRNRSKQTMADLEYFRQQKRAGRQSYFASRVHKGRGRRAAPSSNAVSEAAHESDIHEPSDSSNESNASVNPPVDRFLKRITTELFQTERISASSIQTSILELDSVVQSAPQSSLDLEALSAAISSLPLHDQIGVPSFVLRADRIAKTAELTSVPVATRIQSSVLGDTLLSKPASRQTRMQAPDLAHSSQTQAVKNDARLPEVAAPATLNFAAAAPVKAVQAAPIPAVPLPRPVVTVAKTVPSISKPDAADSELDDLLNLTAPVVPNRPVSGSSFTVSSMPVKPAPTQKPGAALSLEDELDALLGN